ncbi:hypothetical protein MHYP_G00350400 [Metynnis hypsauchen]
MHGCSEVTVTKNQDCLNYCPSCPAGEPDKSLESVRVELLSDIKKNNREVGRMKMDKTFAYRRHEVVCDTTMIKDFQARWPALFEVSEINAEFKRITTMLLQSKFLSQLDVHSKKLMKLYKKKKKRRTNRQMPREHFCTHEEVGAEKTDSLSTQSYSPCGDNHWWGMKVKMWFVALLLISVTQMHAEHSALQAVLSQNGLQKATELGISWLQNQISRTALPEVRGDMDIGIGSVDYVLHDMSIQSYVLPVPSVAFSEGTGVSLQVSGISISIMGHWNLHFGIM